MEEYFNGKKLYGDDFSIEEIEKWYTAENEGYANLGSKDKEKYDYGYHLLNRMYGFGKLKNIKFDKVMGLGSAYGDEFLPIIEQINSITIVEPSDNLISSKIGEIKPEYVKPQVDGSLSFEDGTFDLITCLGTLHHIPNVSFVLSELVRVLKKDGFLLIREPIISMGDWRKPRAGLTKNERGIPVSFFDKQFQKHNLEIISKKYCFTATSFIIRKFGFLFKKPIYRYKLYLWFDNFLSSIFKNNVKYHATTKMQRIAPASIFYVIKKT